MVKLHKVYEARCKAVGKHPFSIFKVTEFCKDNNYSLFHRKKDQCNTCVGYDIGNVPLELYGEHIKRKEVELNLI